MSIKKTSSITEAGVLGDVIPSFLPVIPYLIRNPYESWIPAFAGMEEGHKHKK
jgi:hypothetical protein